MMTRTEQLHEIRKQITRIGHEVLVANTPLPTDKAVKLLAPFGDIEKNIDKIIRRLEK